MSKLTPLLIAAVLTVATMAAALPFENSSVVGHAPDRLMITLEPGVKLAIDKSLGRPLTGLRELDEAVVKHDVTDIELLYGKMIHMFDDPATRALLESVYTVVFPNKASLQAVHDDFAKVPQVREVHPVAICKMYGSAFLPNDLSSNQWYLRNTVVGGGDIRALGGWAEALGDSNVIIAVGDSGVDWAHPDLGGPHPDKVNGAIWTNWAEYYGTPGQDSDGNGFVDDIRGWDFVNLPAGSCYPEEDCVTPDNNPMDFDSHGTNISGMAAAITDNGIGIAGTAPGCKIMALRVGWLPNGTSQGVVRMDFCAQSMVYAAANGAKIYNASWGSTSFLASAVTTCLNAGMLIFTAAGNDNDTVASYLGGYNDTQRRVLAVASTNSGDQKSSFSNYGPWVNLSAPGTAIYTTAYNGFTGESGYNTVQGTSFASPIAAASAALIWSSNQTLTAAQVSALLRNNCDNIDLQNPGFVGQLGAGRVNLLRALGDNVHQIPGEFLFLSDAMNSAAVGDTIKVLASHQLGETTIISKGLTYLGGFDSGYQTRDPLGTPSVINGTLNNPALRFTGAVDASVVVDGFRIQGGGGSTFSNIPYNGRYGGGIMLNGTSPTLRNLHVTGNQVGSSNTLGMGGGIAMHNSQAVLQNVTVDGNSGIYGAGIFIHRGAPVLENVTIAANTPFTGNGQNPPLGGGLHILDADVTLTDVTIDGHAGVQRGGGVYMATVAQAPTLTMTGGAVTNNTAIDRGAGIFTGSGTIELTDVVIGNNSPAPTATLLTGGGLHLEATTVSLDGVVIEENSAQFGGGVSFQACPSISFVGSVVARNVGLLLGGSVYLTGNTSATLANLTVAENHCANGGAGLYANATPLTLSNSIIAFNTGGASLSNGVHIAGAAATLSCNNVFGNANLNYSGIADQTGTNGNISLDPLFCDVAESDYRIQLGSPCAPAQSGACGLIGALEPGCDIANSVEDPLLPLVFKVEANFPNPFNPTTTIRFTTPSVGRTAVLVYDLRGRLIRTLVDAELAAGAHAVQWNGDDELGRAVSTGIYLYRVSNGEHAAVGRMALIK